MDLVSFDVLRTLGLPGVEAFKPEHMALHQERLELADGILFPQYWQVSALVFGLGKRIFPSLATYLVGHDKVEMTRCFQLLEPAHVPETLIAANTPQEAERAWQQFSLPFVAKIPRSSMGEGVFLIDSHADWQRYLLQTPTLYVQEYLPIDRDLRIIWVGRQVVGGFWRLQSADGFHNNLARGGQVVEGILPPAAVALVERLALALGVDHAGFDIAMVGEYPMVLEFNRLFGNLGLAGGQALIDQAVLEYLHGSWWSDRNPPRDPEWPRPRAA